MQPYDNGVAVTPSDSTTFDPVLDGFLVGVAGNVAVLFKGASAAVTLTGLLAGVIYPIRVSKIMATNTTATTMTGLRLSARG